MGTSQIQLAGRCLVLSYAGIPTTTISPFGHRHLAWHFYAGWDEVQKFSNKAGNEIATEV